MIHRLFAIFVMLHGLVHLWYFTLSQKLVKYVPEMGWSGESWLLKRLLGESSISSISSAVFLLSAVLFVVSGVGFWLDTTWWRSIMLASAALSSLSLLVFWDGQLTQLLEKGVIGLLINIIIVGFMLFYK